VFDGRLYNFQEGLCDFHFGVSLCIKGLQALGNDIFKNLNLTTPPFLTPLVLDAVLLLKPTVSLLF
jgi:hypothetical protein